MPSTSASDLRVLSGTPESASSERRRYPRYAFTGTLEAFEPVSQTRIQGRTTDLSEGGCYVDTISPLPAKCRVRVRITRGNRSFESQAIIVYSVAGMGMGLRFESADAAQLKVLRKWLGELSSESTPDEQTDYEFAPVFGSGARNRVLNELVSELMRKGILAAETARGMLQRLPSAA